MEDDPGRGVFWGLVLAVVFWTVMTLLFLAFNAQAQDRSCPAQVRALRRQVAELQAELRQQSYELCVCRADQAELWINYALCLGITRPCPGCWERPVCE